MLDCLCDRFAHVARAVWVQRLDEGRVTDAEGRPLDRDTPYRVGLTVRYGRANPAETPIPFSEEVLHVDAHLVVAYKPPFLPVTPTGPWVEQTLLHRLRHRLALPDLVPLHRLDRLTSGLVLLSAEPATRARYHALFRERRIEKRYEAVAPRLQGLVLPHRYQSRLERGTPFFRMREVPGEANCETLIVGATHGVELSRYELAPRTGRKHQLRVHLAALGAPIVGDPCYPELVTGADDYGQPLQLLARELSFTDPVTGAERHFHAGRTLTLR